MKEITAKEVESLFQSGQTVNSHGFNVMNMTGGMMAWEGKVV